MLRRSWVSLPLILLLLVLAGLAPAAAAASDAYAPNSLGLSAT